MESIERINDWLRKEYGIETTSSRPMYRVVWANDQLEKRLMKYTDSGLQLITPEIREVPKYKQFKDMYVLERLSYIDSVDPTIKEMTVQEVSYEPIWSFVDNKLNPLPPRIDICKIVIDTLHMALYSDKSGFAKYKDTNEDVQKERRESLEQIQNELFGNETTVGDALAYKEGVGYTGPSKIESEKVH